jgi:hypothetical protein
MGEIAECRRDEIDEWRFVADLAITKQLGGGDVTAPAMSFDATPVINSPEKRVRDLR